MRDRPAEPPALPPMGNFREGARSSSRSSRRSRSRSRSSRRRSSSSSSGSCRRSNRGGGGGGANGSGSGSEACLTCCGFLSICRRTSWLASSRFPIATPPPEALACNICSTLHRLSFLVRNVSFFSGTKFLLFSAGFLNLGFRLSLYVCHRCSKAFVCLFLRCWDLVLSWDAFQNSGQRRVADLGELDSWRWRRGLA